MHYNRKLSPSLLRFTREIKEKTGFQIGWYWQICWVVLFPLVLTILMGFSLVSYFGDMSYDQFDGCAGINSGLVCSELSPSFGLPWFYTFTAMWV